MLELRKLRELLSSFFKFLMIPPSFLVRKPFREMNRFLQEILNIFLLSWKKRDSGKCHLSSLFFALSSFYMTVLN